MTEKLLMALTLHLASKKTLIGPELGAYLEGLAYCERALRLHNKALDEVINDDYSGEDLKEDKKPPSRLSDG